MNAAFYYQCLRQSQRKLVLRAGSVNPASAHIEEINPIPSRLGAKSFFKEWHLPSAVLHTPGKPKGAVCLA
jgi:hypothetical protein